MMLEGPRMCSYPFKQEVYLLGALNLFPLHLIYKKEREKELVKFFLFFEGWGGDV